LRSDCVDAAEVRAARSRFGFAVALVVLILTGTGCRGIVGPEPDHHRVYKIGFGNARPLHFPDASGQPTGLAVGLVREAARRRGIELQWVRSETPGIDAMQKGEADLWVLVTDTPERRNQVHFTEPYLVTEYCFLVRAAAPYNTTADLANARITSLGFGIHRIHLKKLLPNAELSIADSTDSAFEAMQNGSADAIFVEQYTASDMALNGRLRARMRIISAAVPRGYMGLAANFNVSPIADEIRAEMRSMEKDGSLAPLFEGWSFFPGLNFQAMESLSNAKQRERVLVAGVTTLLIFLGCTLALIASLKKQRDALKLMKSALRESEEYHRTLFALLPDTIYVLHCKSGAESGERTFRQVSGHDPALKWLTGTAGHRDRVNQVIATGVMAVAEESTPENRLLEYRLVPLREMSGDVSGVMGILRDRTDWKNAEDERAELEEQLLQSRKMEVVGRLAGGVAHDFNNLLTVICGYSDLLLADLPADSIASRQLGQILTAGQRAGGLTQQLLAFSRRQVVQPKPADLNEIVGDASEMIGRLLGDDVELQSSPGMGLPRVVVDRGQVDQVLMNLAANARDAMPEGGTFALSTSVIEWTEENAHRDLEGSPGTYVVLTATDTGEGMDSATTSRIFEPFFTTKPVGEGTGLGLSTVYGIVKQSGGWIGVESELGSGTTFRIFLPAHREENRDTPEPSRTTLSFNSTPESATILLLEDQPDIRKLAFEVLTANGFRVMEASTPAEALLKSEGFDGEIDLLLTDIVMAGMRGSEVARRIRAQRPKIRLLFASGYAGDLNSGRDQLVLESELLQKPFGAGELIETVRRCLNAAGKAIPAS
jgi:two-component system, cell cycle sensor histidine kinase and response regulator CckA